MAQFQILLDDHQHEVLLRVTKFALAERETTLRRYPPIDAQVQANLADTVATLAQVVEILKASRVGTIEHVPAQ